MTVEEQTPRSGACLPVERLPRRPETVERADPAAPPNLPPPDSRDELVTIRNMVVRLRAVYPSVDAVAVEMTVRTAYDSFRQARVRAYIPILVERRSRRELGAACRAAPGRAAGGSPAAALPEPGAAVRSGGGVEAAACDRPGPEPRRPHPEPGKG
jgi:hypothetical protein